MLNVSEITLEFKGGTYTIRSGQEVRLSYSGAGQGFGSMGDGAVVDTIEGHGCPEDAEIVVRKLSLHDNWEDGEWLTLCVGDFINFFSLEEDVPQVVNRDLKFKDINLKGMRCRILAQIDRREVFVEMENDIGGGSCDGIGRKGHCIPIKKEFLTVSSKEKSKKA